MKKLRLKALSLGAKEILNREQLKNIYGGDGSNSTGPSGPGHDPYVYTCYCYDYSSNYIHFGCPSLTDWRCGEIAGQYCDQYIYGYGCNDTYYDCAGANAC